MEENMIMTNEEEAYENDATCTEELETESNRTGVVGLGLVIGTVIGVGSTFAYRYIVKPMMAKLKSRKKAAVDNDDAEVIVMDADSVKECDEEDC